MPSTADVEDPLALDRNVVRLPHAIDVHVEKERVAGSEFAELLANEHPVGAQDDCPLALLDSSHQLADRRDRSSVLRRRSTPPAQGTRRRQPGIRRSMSFCLIVDSYSRIRPQPVHVKLHACSGSSISTMGNFLAPERRCARHSRRFGWSSAMGKAWASSSSKRAGWSRARRLRSGRKGNATKARIPARGRKHCGKDHGSAPPDFNNRARPAARESGTPAQGLIGRAGARPPSGSAPEP